MAALAGIALGLGTAGNTAPVHGRAAGVAGLDPLLQATLATALPGDTLMLVGDLDHVPTPADVAALTSVGAQVAAFHTLPLVAIQSTAAQVPALQASPLLSSLWLDHAIEPVLHESVPLIRADAVRQRLGYDGRGIGVAIVDSGIDGSHPDVAYPSHTVANVLFAGYTKLLQNDVLVQENVPNTDTTSGHGTSVASIAAGTGAASGGYYTGVAPGANLVGIGAGQGFEMIATVAGLDWANEHRTQYNIRVVNCSWADGTITYDPGDPINVATRTLHDNGIVVVMAAGNDGPNPGTLNRYAFAPWVTVVAGSDKLAAVGSYSSRGDGVHNPTVMAPGSYIAAARASTGVDVDANTTPFDLTDPSHPRMVPAQLTPYYTVGLGTSLAAPHVTGVVALMLQAAPSLSPDQVRDILAATAVPVPGCPITDCGSGEVDAYAAVERARLIADVPPSATLTATPATGNSPLSVSLDASGSQASAGRTIVGYRWDPTGSGSVISTTTPTLAFSYATGRWTARVAAVDDLGGTSAWATVSVLSDTPPTARATVPSRAGSGQSVTFDGTASSSPDSTIVSWTWTFGDGASAGGAAVTHTYSVGRARLLAWSLVVTDALGRSNATSGQIKIVP